jgi:hypothetical protein
MKYQNRKHLMMADMGVASFSGHSMTDSSIATPRRQTSSGTDKSHTRNQSAMKEVKLQELTLLSLGPIFRSIHHWWLKRAEHHFLICADVEEQRAREAQLNVAYYQKRAAIARSSRM